MEEARELPVVPSCALDADGLRAQRNRYAALAGSVASRRREGESVEVTFDESLDRQLLDEALSVERECCPFFRFDFAEDQRRLRIGVAEPAQEPALDALFYSLGGSD